MKFSVLRRATCRHEFPKGHSNMTIGFVTLARFAFCETGNLRTRKNCTKIKPRATEQSDIFFGHDVVTNHDSVSLSLSLYPFFLPLSFFFFCIIRTRVVWFVRASCNLRGLVLVRSGISNGESNRWNGGSASG